MDQQRESLTKLFLTMVDAAVQGKVVQLRDVDMEFLKASNTNALIQIIETECLKANIEACLLTDGILHDDDVYYDRMINFVAREYQKDMYNSNIYTFLELANTFKERYEQMEVGV